MNTVNAGMKMPAFAGIIEIKQSAFQLLFLNFC